MPSVPFINEVIGIPSDKAINTYINNATYEYIDNVKLIPSQELLPEDQISTDFTINNQFYNSTENFPNLEVCASNPYILRDIRISNISIYPFLYSAADRKVKIMKNFKVIVNYSNSNTTNILLRENMHIGEQWVETYKSLIKNFNFLSLPEIERPENQIDLAVICADEYAESLIEFVHSKTLLGFSTRLITLSEINLLYSYPTIEERVKAQINTLYTQCGLSYVLFVGDQYDIPPKTDFGLITPYEPLSYAWYGLLEGDDYMNEVLVGNFLVSNELELSNLVRKSIEYNYSTWINRALLVAGNESSFSNSIQESSDSLTSIGFETIVLDNFTNNGISTIDIIDNINEGLGLIAYRGHGRSDSWQGLFQTNHFTSFNNSVYPVVLSFACMNGAIYPQAFAPSFINSSVGAISIVASSLPSFRSINNNLLKSMIEQFSDGNVNITSALNNCFADYFGSIADHDVYKYHKLMYNTFGDPTIRLLHPNISELYADIDYENNSVNIYDSSGIPVEGVKVVVVSNNNIQENTITDAYGAAYFNDISVNIEIGWSKNGYIPGHTTILSENITLNSDSKFTGDIIVSENTTCTIDDEVNLPPYAKLYILENAILILNTNSTLSSSNDINSMFCNGNIELGEDTAFEGNSNSRWDPIKNILLEINDQLLDVRFSDVYICLPDTVSDTDLSFNDVRFVNSVIGNYSINNISVQDSDFRNCNLFISSNSTFDIRNSSFQNCNINASCSSLLVNDCTLNNSFINAIESSNVLIEDSEIDGEVYCLQVNNFGMVNTTVSGYGCGLIFNSIDHFNISHCHFDNNQYNGIRIKNANVNRNILSNCSISHNNDGGVFINNSCLSIEDCTIEENGSYGLLTSGTSFVRVKAVNDHSRIRQNGLFQVGQTHDLIDLRGGNNEIVKAHSEQNCGSISEVLMYTADQSTDLIHAENNYWGYRSCNNAAYCPILPPDCQLYHAGFSNNPNETGYLLTPLWAPNLIDLLSYDDDSYIFYSAIDSATNGDIEYAIALFKNLISNYPDSYYLKSSAKYLYALEEDKTSLLSYYDEEQNLQFDDIDKTLDFLKIHCNIKLGSLDDAIDSLENIITGNTDVADSLQASVDIAYIQLLSELETSKDNGIDIKNMEQIKTELNFISNQYHNKVLKLFTDTENSMGNNEVIHNSSYVGFLSNYPNPFNPETTISYNLLNAGDIEIAIYNLKGQKVKTLISEYQEIGNHQVIWDGKDIKGNKVASGVYFYKVNAGESEIIKKMVLMK